MAALELARRLAQEEVLDRDPLERSGAVARYLVLRDILGHGGRWRSLREQGVVR